MEFIFSNQNSVPGKWISRHIGGDYEIEINEDGVFIASFWPDEEDQVEIGEFQALAEAKRCCESHKENLQ